MSCVACEGRKLRTAARRSTALLEIYGSRLGESCANLPLLTKEDT